MLVDTLDSSLDAFSFICRYLFWNLVTSANILETRVPTALPADILTLPLGCFDIRNSKAARFDLSTNLHCGSMQLSNERRLAIQMEVLRDAVDRAGFDSVEDSLLGISPLPHNSSSAIRRFDGEGFARKQSTL